jgi:hypothetical protein
LTSDGAARLKRILFVDDDANILESLRDPLRPWRSDWRATFARGAEAPLEELSRESFDVVARGAGVAHRLLAKPCDLQQLGHALTQASTLGGAPAASRGLGGHVPAFAHASAGTRRGRTGSRRRRRSRLVLGPTAKAGGDPLQMVFSVAYPVGDMILIVGLASVHLRGVRERTRRALWLLAGGLVLFVVAFALFAAAGWRQRLGGAELEAASGRG